MTYALIMSHFNNPPSHLLIKASKETQLALEIMGTWWLFLMRHIPSSCARFFAAMFYWENRDKQDEGHREFPMKSYMWLGGSEKGARQAIEWRMKQIDNIQYYRITVAVESALEKLSYIERRAFATDSLRVYKLAAKIAQVRDCPPCLSTAYISSTGVALCSTE